jgi:hypothetical protein
MTFTNSLFVNLGSSGMVSFHRLNSKVEADGLEPSSVGFVDPARHPLCPHGISLR